MNFRILISLLISIYAQIDAILHGNINFIQANQISVVFTTNIFNQNLSTQFIQAFSVQPLILTGITGFDINVITPTLILRVQNINKTKSSALFNIAYDGSYIRLQSLSLRYIALTIANIIIVQYNHQSIVCNSSQLSLLATCMQDWTIAYPTNSYYAVSHLTGFNITSKNYNADFTFFEATDTLSFPYVTTFVTVGGFIQLNNFFEQYMILPLVTAYSNNITAFSEFLSLDTSSNFYHIPTDNFSPGYISKSIDMFIFIRGFKFFTSFDFTFLLNASTLLITLSNVIDPAAVIHYGYTIFGVGDCPKGTFINWQPSLYCSQCSSNCLSCIFSLCFSCDLILYRYLYITDNINLGGDCLCIPGYVQFNQVCVSCDTSCYQCAYDPTHCTNCFPGYQLISNRCVSFCILRYLFDGHNGCIICPQGCSSCSNTSTCSTFTCSIGIYSQHNCVDQCPFSTFELADINSCQECVHPCLQCSNFTTCISCYMGFYLNTGNNFCYPCSLGCFNCTTPDTCFQCGYFYILMNGTCIIKSACMLNLYVCSDCSNNCVNCSLTECYECSTAFLLLNGSCHTCNISGLQLINNQCIEVCGDGKKILDECDDGNVIDGDGCSKNCSIQENYYCEGDKNHPDFCWPSNSQLNVDIAKSLINNSVKITLTSRSLTFTNIVDLSINCENDIKQNNTYIYINQNTSYSIIIAYSRQFVNRRCNITIATHPIQEILIATMPKSYYYDPSLLNFIIRMSVVLKYLSLISTVTILVTHFFSNAQSTVLFMEALFIYIFSLFNCKYISPVVYNFIPELKYFLLMYNTNTDVFRNQSFSDGLIFMLKKNSFQTNTQSIFIVFLLYLLITIFLMAISQSVNESLSKLYTRNLIQYRLFFYNTYSLFEPMLLFCFLNNIYHTTQTISIVLQTSFTMILFIIIIWNISNFRKLHNKLIRELRLPQKLRFYSFLILLSLQNFTNYLSFLSLFVFSMGILLLKLKKMIKIIKRATFRKRILIFQSIYNEIFVIINSILIWLQFWLSRTKTIVNYYNCELIFGIINITNLFIFLIINLIILLLIFTNKISRIRKQNNKINNKKKENQHKSDKSSNISSKSQFEVSNNEILHTGKYKITTISQNQDNDLFKKSESKIIYEI